MSVGEAAITIRKVKKVMPAAHHGGAWKVAYADFVTAMMAFFLLMWLINTTSPEQKRGIADYFAPASVSETTSGAGGILAGTALGDDGAKGDGSASVIEQLSPEAPEPTDPGQSSTPLSAASEEALREALRQKEEAAFQSAAQSLRQAMQSMPELAELSKQIQIDQTPEGLRIQLIDQEGRSMFNEGSSVPNERARVLLRAVAKIVNQLPNQINIAGHTSVGSSGRAAPTDRLLSFTRADAARAFMEQAGVDSDRTFRVIGAGNAEPLYADDPTMAGNRRISILLLRQAPVLPPNVAP